MTAQEFLAWVKAEYQKEKATLREYQTLVFMMRNNIFIKAAGLTDLCWSMYRDGNITEGDMEGLIEGFERWVNQRYTIWQRIEERAWVPTIYRDLTGVEAQDRLALLNSEEAELRREYLGTKAEYEIRTMDRATETPPD